MSSESLGTESIKKLIFNLGWPAAMNFLVITVYNLTDVIFVGQWLGSLQIAAVVVVGTVYFLFSSLGLVTGIGGASIIARALGEKDREKANYVFGNQMLLVTLFSGLIVAGGFVFEDSVLRLFGANGEIFPYASAYYRILLVGIPLTSWSGIGNSVIQTEGKAKIAMFNSLVPTVANILLNPLFIKGFGMGIEGAAWATLIAYGIGLAMVLRFFAKRLSELDLHYKYWQFRAPLVREIAAIGGSVLVNIVTANLFIIVLNQMLYKYQQESGVVMYGIINRVNMLFLIPIIAIDGAIRPIIGYNFGSGQTGRIRETIHLTMKYGMLACYFMLAALYLTAGYFIHIFTSDAHLVVETPYAMKVVFSFFPLLVIQTIVTSYFQSVGKPKVSFYLTILRNIVLLIPLLYLSSYFFGYYGILYTFPVVDVLTTIPAVWLLRNELNARLAVKVAAG